MTYLQFHLVFLLPVLVVLLLVTAGKLRLSHVISIAAVDVIALIYTVPWDITLVANRGWTYPVEEVLGTIAGVPLEEYLFIILQPIITGLWACRSSLALPTADESGKGLVRWGGTALILAISLWGKTILAHESTYYLGMIVAWAGPVLALQWAVGGHQVWARKQLVAWGALVPTIYLCLADRVAIWQGIWEINPAKSTGAMVLGLPAEEIVFFTVTNLLIVQGVLLMRLRLEDFRQVTIEPLSS